MDYRKKWNNMEKEKRLEIDEVMALAIAGNHYLIDNNLAKPIW